MVTESRRSTRRGRLALVGLALLAAAALLTHMPRLVAWARLNTGYVWLNRGLAEAEPAKVERATRFFTAGSDDPASRRSAWRGLGLAYVSQGRFEAAGLAWQQIGGLDGFEMWGLQAEQAGNWTGARDWYGLATRSAPQNGDYWYLRARAAAQASDSAAAGFYREALAAPESRRFGRSNTLTRLAELAKQEQPPDWDAALARFEEAIQQDEFIAPEDALLAGVGRAEALDKLGRTPEALAAYREVAASWPDHYWANVHSGRLSWYLERDETAAVRYLERAIAADPRPMWAYLFLGSVYAESGQPEKAIPLLRHVLTIEPDNEAARRQIQKLTGENDS